MANYLQELLGDSYKEGMSLDEISNALQEKQVTLGDKAKDTSDTEKKYKELLSKANSEAASYKKELRAKMSEQEAKEAERNEQLEELQNKLAVLEKEKKVAEYTTKFTSVGYDTTVATECANALLDGDIDTVLENQKKYLQVQRDLIKSDLMKATPRPESGNSSGATKTISKEQLFAMPLKDRMKFAQEHREQYEQIVKGESVQI